MTVPNVPCKNEETRCRKKNQEERLSIVTAKTGVVCCSEELAIELEPHTSQQCPYDKKHVEYDVEYNKPFTSQIFFLNLCAFKIIRLIETLFD